jgi:hypothetical protein
MLIPKYRIIKRTVVFSERSLNVILDFSQAMYSRTIDNVREIFITVDQNGLYTDAARANNVNLILIPDV